MELDPARDYPLGSRRPELLTTPNGLQLDEITLDALRAGRLDGEDLRATPDTIRAQAAVAEAAGRRPLAENLLRAAELAQMPTDLLLEVYTALRPRRATAAVLEEWAQRLEDEYAAQRCAAFVREAADAYAARGLLAADERVAPQV